MSEFAEMAPTDRGTPSLPLEADTKGRATKVVRWRGSRSTLVGNVDAWAPELIGWVYDTESPDRHLELAVLVDNIEVARVVASEPRADVVRTGHSVLECGFSLNLQPHATGLTQIRLVDVATETEIFVSPPDLRANVLSPKADPESVGPASIQADLGSDDDLAASIRRSGSVALLSTFRDIQTSDLPLRHLIGALNEQGIAVIAVDTSPEEPHETFGADKLLWRKNVGWDFASWFTALDRHREQIEGAERLYLMNDSCIGPFGGLSTVLERGWATGLDAWSLTDSWEISYHLQSYFMAFGPNSLGSGLLTAFADQYDYPVVKNQIIRSGEVALTRFLRTAGLSVGAVFAQSDLIDRFLDSFEDELRRRMAEPQVRAIREYDPEFIPSDVRGMITTFDAIRAGRSVNSTHSLWLQLLESGYPFIKRELATRDPAGISDLLAVGRWISAHATDAELDVVRADLGQRSMFRTVIIER